MATAWHETAFPVPAHAAITGESMEENRAATTVMDKNRRIFTKRTIPLVSPGKQWDSRVWQINLLNLRLIAEKANLPPYLYWSQTPEIGYKAQN